jgi:hypothetical protein
MSQGFKDEGADPEVLLVIRSVLPVFDHERQRPERVGSCVLLRIDKHPFIVTAAHVIEDIDRSGGHFTVAVGGKLIALHRDRFTTPHDHPADIGLIPLRPRTAVALTQNGGVFLDREQFVEREIASGTDISQMLANTYFAVGFPASRSYSRIQHAQNRIHVKTYSVRLTLAPTDIYPEGLSHRTHLLLDYAPHEIVLAGRRVNPPTVQGMSGGGAFRFHRRRPETTRLVGILIERHRTARVIAATRAAVVAELARAVIALHPDAFC